MTLHQAIQKVLLIGARLEKLAPAPTPQPPQKLKPLIDAIDPAHRHYDERAIFYGHRYRSGFWAIYLLSAVAVLCAVVPLSLGWDSRGHTPRPNAGLWAMAEVLVIAIVSVIYWRAHRVKEHEDRGGQWAIYLLTAVAILCAVAPLALGWEDVEHSPHPFAGLWAVAEVCIIATVSVIYWRGHRGDWQGEWLRTRTTAELTWYLPLLAPLVDYDSPNAKSDPNWYARVFDPGQHMHVNEEVSSICSKNEALARECLKDAWQDLGFVTGYAHWTIDILEGQRLYHHGVALKQHTVMHRVHALNNWLFGLTALGALLHLILHTLWLTLVTTFFPALGASLHGALAQSEAYRLSATSERLVNDLQTMIDRIRAALAVASTPVSPVLAGSGIRTIGAARAGAQAATAPRVAAVKSSIEDALALILEEHQDWQMLVRPHHLPLA
jgi:hypothetical protein